MLVSIGKGLKKDFTDHPRKKVLLNVLIIYIM